MASLPAEKLLEVLSYSHFELLGMIEDPHKRLFYEVEAVGGVWSVRDLKRQIASLYYERSGLSRNKKKLAALVETGLEHANLAAAIRDLRWSPSTGPFWGLAKVGSAGFCLL